MHMCIYKNIYFKHFKSLQRVSVESTQLIYHCLPGPFWIFPSVVSLYAGEIVFFLSSVVVLSCTPEFRVGSVFDLFR